MRRHGKWEVWLELFLIGIEKTAREAIQSTQDIIQQLDNDSQKIHRLGRARFNALKTFEYLKELPQTNVSQLANALNISAPSARNALQNLRSIGVVTEITGKQRSKVYTYKKYLDILEWGTLPIKSFSTH